MPYKTNLAIFTIGIMEYCRQVIDEATTRINHQLLAENANIQQYIDTQYEKVQARREQLTQAEKAVEETYRQANMQLELANVLEIELKQKAARELNQAKRLKQQKKLIVSYLNHAQPQLADGTVLDYDSLLKCAKKLKSENDIYHA